MEGSHAAGAIAQFRSRFPDLRFESYQMADIETFLRRRLADADVVLVNEWNDPQVIRTIGRLCQEIGVVAVFHAGNDLGMLYLGGHRPEGPIIGIRNRAGHGQKY